MKNYYEILEVDKNASKEVIEKAYRTLAKKYHPDLHQGIKKQEYAEKMKIINEAYDILADELKKSQYDARLQDEQLRNHGISKEEQERILQENYQLKQQLNKIGNQYINYQVATKRVNNNYQQSDDSTIFNMSRVLTEQIKSARRQAYHDAYVEDLKNRGYKIRYRHDFKYYLKVLKFILITILICFIVYQIPPIKQFFNNLYNENSIFEAIVNIFKKTISVQFF